MTRRLFRRMRNAVCARPSRAIPILIREGSRKGMSKITPSNGRTAIHLVGALCRPRLPTITAQIVNLLYNIGPPHLYRAHPARGQARADRHGRLTFPVITLISAFSALVGTGGAPRASIALGAGETARRRTHARHLCRRALEPRRRADRGCSCCFQRDPPAAVRRVCRYAAVYAMQYLSIYVRGTVFVMTALGLNGFITAQGRSSVAMKTVVIGAILNVLLDPAVHFRARTGVCAARQSPPCSRRRSLRHGC